MATHNSQLKLAAKLQTLEQIQGTTAQLFQEAQIAASGHRKQVILLKRIHARALELDLGEPFSVFFTQLLNKVLPVKRGERVAENIAKFCAAYVASIQTADAEGEPYIKFTTFLLRHLLQGLEAKLKNVRYRAIQLITVIMSGVSEMDEELYQELVYSLNRRLYDKESLVRVMAVRSISRLQGHECDDPTSETIDEAVEKLLNAVQNDASPEVRKNALVNVVANQATKNFIIERARDENSVIRRSVFSTVVRKFGDFRTLDFKTRERLLEWGLKDRDESVQKAAVKMLSFEWFDAIEGDLVEFIERLHVVESPVADTALRLFLTARPDQAALVSLMGEWKQLTVESAFLARVFLAHCTEQRMAEVVDRNFPEATDLASYLQRYLELRSKMAMAQSLSPIEAPSVESNEEPSVESNEEPSEEPNGEPNGEPSKEPVEEPPTNSVSLTPDQVALDFIIQQLLLIAQDYDFSDDFGRRSMLQVLRSSLTNDTLTDTLTEHALRVLHKISINEHDFCSMVVEIITDVRDVDDDFHSDDDGPEKREREIPENVWLQCLSIAQHLLELTEEPLRDNIALNSILETLINPAIVTRKPNLRAAGIRCLGLCCLLDKSLAEENLFLFGLCAARGDEALRVTSIKTIIDVLCIHGTSVLDNDKEGYVDHLSLAKLYYKTLRAVDYPQAQYITAEGLMKLYFADIMVDDDLFETLILTYHNPQNSTNEPLKQALNFCLPVYAYSHPEHQERLARVSGDAFSRLSKEYAGLAPEDQRKMATPSKILLLMVDWTDPEKVVNRSSDQAAQSPSHVILALTLLEVVEVAESTAIRKLIFNNLPKLAISARIPVRLLRPLFRKLESFEQALEDEHFELDRTSAAAFVKYKTWFDELYEEAKVAQDTNGDTTVMQQTLVSSESETELDPEADILGGTDIEANSDTEGPDAEGSSDESEERISSPRDRSRPRTKDDTVFDHDSPSDAELTDLHPSLRRAEVSVVSADPIDPEAAKLAEIDRRLKELDTDSEGDLESDSDVEMG